MANDAAQSYENHAKLVPGFHFVAFGMFALNLLWSLYRIIVSPSLDTTMSLILAVALILLFFYARLFALAVQDRVIRLEMRLRMERLLPDDLTPRIGDLTADQFVSLRFAVDAELPGLVRKVLDENLTDRKTIKQLITDWQADLLRA